MRGGVPVKKRGGRFDQPPLMGLDVRRYFFLMTIEPLKVLSRSDAPPLFTTTRSSFGEIVPCIVMGKSQLTWPLKVIFIQGKRQATGL